MDAEERKRFADGDVDMASRHVHASGTLARWSAVLEVSRRNVEDSSLCCHRGHGYIEGKLHISVNESHTPTSC